jgi:hypothetical protein
MILSAPSRRALPLRPPSFLMWASAAVLSILQRIDDWRVDAGRISVRKIHKTPSSLTLKSDAS